MEKEAMVSYGPGPQGGDVNSGLTAAMGAYRPTGLQNLIIGLVRKNLLLRSAVRTRANRLLQKLKPGPIDHNLFGWMFRFFPAENTGDRKALLTPSGFDKAECDLIANHLSESGVFLDIGSNIGVYSFYVAAQRKDARIIAFEPTPRAFAKLSYNLASNNLTNRVTALNIALSNKKGKMHFNTELECLVLGDANILVNTDTLLNVLNDNGISKVEALKIDVEGAEDLILKPFFTEAPRSIWPSLIVIEHLFPNQWEWNCIKFIEENGYQTVWRGKMNTVYKMSEQ